MITQYLKLEIYREKVNKKFDYNVYSEPKTYSQDYKIEFEKGINFPLEKPEYIIVKSNELWKFDKKIAKNEMNEILKILNDSTNYQWGEIGTPYFDKYLLFYNAKDECVGVTEVSYDGQTYSTPNLIRMKWGFNTKTSELQKLIEK